MFEDKTYEGLIKSVLSRISGELDKRQGSVIYDAIAPLCVELAQAYIRLDWVLNQVFADTAGREYLIRRAAERCMKPYEASAAVILADMSGSFSLSGGERFNVDELNYVYEGETAAVEGKMYYCLKCETAGEAGNIETGRIIPIDSIKGLEGAEVFAVYTLGNDEESTENFRERYLSSLNSQAFGGNAEDYKNKVKEAAAVYGGVGGVKVYRADEWNGGGTVKIVVTDSEYAAPDAVTGGLVEKLQQVIDPTNTGDGTGIAPIGHIVTVAGAMNAKISVSLGIEYAEGYSFDMVRETVSTAIDEYFLELNKEWENQSNIIVIKNYIISRLLTIRGIVNITDIKISAATDVIADNDANGQKIALKPNYVARLAEVDEL